MLPEKSFARKSKLKAVLPINFILPNLITLFSLACGMTAMSSAVEGRWELAAALILLAAVFDGLDGRVARLLGSTSKFGAELDSLADFISFGVSPAFVMYLWSLDSYPNMGWAVSLVFAICCALRLARFNTMLEDENRPRYWDYFFTGMPAPAGAVVGIIPLMMWLYSSPLIFVNTWFVSCFLLLAAFLMASRVPTLCIKKLKIRAKDAPLLMIVMAVYVGFMLTEFWLVVSLSAFVYLCLIPFGVHLFNNMKKEYEHGKE